MTGVEVVVPEVIHHLERLLVRAAGVARDVVQEVVRLTGVAFERVDRDDVASRAVGELRGAGERVVDDAELDRLLEVAERLVELALVPVDVRALVVAVALNLVVRRRVLDDFAVRLRGEIPLARIALRFVEEELTEREIRIRDELRVGSRLDEIVVDRARVLEVARLLVLVREVVEDLVERAVRRVVVDDQRVVLDRLLATGASSPLRPGSPASAADRRLCGFDFFKASRLISASVLSRNAADFELDVLLGESASELRPVRRRSSSWFSKSCSVCWITVTRSAAFARVGDGCSRSSRGASMRRHVRLRLLIALLEIRRRRRRVEVHLRRLAVLADVELFRVRSRPHALRDCSQPCRRCRRRRRPRWSSSSRPSAPFAFELPSANACSTLSDARTALNATS